MTTTATNPTSYWPAEATRPVEDTTVGRLLESAADDAPELLAGSSERAGRRNRG